MRDLHNNLNAFHATSPQVATTDVLSDAIDLQGYEGAEIFALLGASGTSLSGSVKVEGKLTECATSGGSYTAVAEADMLGAISGTSTGSFFLADATSEDETTYKVGYIGSKRYLKVNLDLTGTFSGGGIPVGVVVARGVPRRAAVS